MKKTVLLFLALFICMTSASAASVSSNVTSVKTASSYSAPSGYEPKGYIGNIISQIFDPVGQILSNYVLAFQNILTVNNTVPVWNSITGVFDVGSISQDSTGNVLIGSGSNSKDLRVFGDIIAENVTDPSGNSFGGKFIDGANITQAVYMTGNVGIGVNNPTEKLFVDGRITVTGTPNSMQDIGNVSYNDGRYINVGESINGDSITDNTIDSSEIENGTLSSIDILDNTITTSDIQNYTISDSDIRDNTIIRSVASISLIGPRAGRLGAGNDDGSATNPHNMFLGHYAGYKISTGTNNIALGQRSGYENTTGYNNTFVGLFSGSDNTTGNQNTFIGLDAGRLNTTGGNNIAIGSYSTLPSSTGSNQISIGNRIYGTSSGNIGIGTDSPSQRLDVNGKIRMRSQTLVTDSTDTVATKGYVDSALGGGGGKFVDGSTVSQAVYMTGNVGIGVNNPTEKLFVDGRISVTGTPNSLQDIGNVSYNDGRYINVGEGISGDSITDNTIDSSEIQNDSIVEADISNAFVARNSFLLGGRALNEGSNGNTVVSRDASGDINARLFKSEYDSTNSNIGFIMTQVDTATNNYIRPSTPAQFRASVTDSSYINIGSSGDQIQDNTIDSSEIENGTITSADIQDNSLTHNDVNLTCTRRSTNNPPGQRRTNAVCLAGETVTGGGCYSYNGVDNLQTQFIFGGGGNMGSPVVPMGQQGYQCYHSGGNDYTVTAMCCRF